MAKNAKKDEKPTSNIFTSDTAVARGVRTGLQAVIGFLVGLLVVVWQVPGVPEAVRDYLASNWAQLAAIFGIPAGIAGFAWNVFRKGVRNW